MIEMSTLRKNKITLSDYDFRRDIQNRLVISQFSSLDMEILEEILYSSITIPIRKIAKNLHIDEQDVFPTLEKLKQTGLLTVEGEIITVDKEKRKYFEFQILKFDDDFKPGMEFLQGLLRKIPIHILPTWYSIPRSSNNIIDSLIEKYLFTPQIFQRYIAEMESNFGNSVLLGMIQDVYYSPELKVPSKELMEKYSLSREQFEEYMLHLEFSFICCSTYTKAGDGWRENVQPFHEWKEYLTYLRGTEPSRIENPEEIVRERQDDFSFIKDMAQVLKFARNKPFPPEDACKLIDIPPKQLSEVIAKLAQLKLTDIVDGRLYALQAANDWIDMNCENRALYIYRHPLNRLKTEEIPTYLCTERNLRECEKSISRVLNAGWVYFDDFVKGVNCVLSDQSTIFLKKTGKVWQYTLPQYTLEETKLIHATIFEWLFEIGVVNTGTHKGKDCFCVTPFGQSLFRR